MTLGSNWNQLSEGHIEYEPLAPTSWQVQIPSERGQLSSFSPTSSFDQFSGGLTLGTANLFSLRESGADPAIANTIPGDITTSATITLGTPVNGVIDFAGDSDWYAVTLTAGKTYQFSLSSSGSGALPGGDTFIAIYNASGELMTSDDDGGAGAGSQASFTAHESTVYYVSAEAYGNGTGNYAIEVNQIGNGSAGDTVRNGVIANIGTLVIDGAATAGTINYLTDQDWFAVELTAGTTYTFDMAATGGSSLDTLLSLHDADGVYLDFNDDAGAGTNSQLVFDALSSGTYYIAAEAFTGTNSSATGNYTLSVTSSGGGGGGGDTGSPLDAIDWGTQLGSNTITVYFASAGERFSGESSNGWTQADIDATMAALSTFEDYIDVTFEQVFSSAGATFRLMTDTLNDGTLGYFYPPGEGAASGIGVFITNGYGWSANGLQQFGFGWVTLIHEAGHGLGLAHPHDDGGTSTIMNGVSNDADTGDYALNQGVFTTMTYVDGWQSSPYGQSSNVSYGYQGTIMPLDIALLQEKYGANTTHNAGNTIYELATRNEAGTGWSAIWDTSGNKDMVVANTGKDAIIDLRPATLAYENGGGGYVSAVSGIHGGFTIANGADIENARGGHGDDIIIGNTLGNKLIGRNGADDLSGLSGDDVLYGGNDNDILRGGAGRDQMFGQAGSDTFVFEIGDTVVGSIDRIYDFTPGDLIDIGVHSFVGEGSYTGDTGVEVRLVISGDKYRLDIDYDGDNTTDEQILLVGMTAGDVLTSDGSFIGVTSAPAAAAAEMFAFEPVPEPAHFGDWILAA